MTPASRAALRLAAEKATPGPWQMPDDTCVIHNDGRYIVGDPDHYSTDEDLEYIAAANPAAILELLTALDRAEACVEAARQYVPEPHIFNTSGAIQDRIRKAIKEYDAHSRSAGQAGETE